MGSNLSTFPSPKYWRLTAASLLLQVVVESNAIPQLVPLLAHSENKIVVSYPEGKLGELECRKHQNVQAVNNYSISFQLISGS